VKHKATVDFFNVTNSVSISLILI